MVLWCCACRRVVKNEENVHLHRFPKGQRDTWLNKLGLVGDPKYWRVCSEHFKSEDYTAAVVSGKLRLKKNAIPSLKLKQHKINKSSSNDDVNNHSERVEVVHDKPLEVQEIKIENSEEVTNVKPDIFDPDYMDLSKINDHDCYGFLPIQMETSKVTPFSANTDFPVKPMRASLKRKVSSRSSDLWEDFKDDEQFLNYRKISDVQWERIVHDPKKATICWNIAIEMLQETKEENKRLRIENRKQKLKIAKLGGLMERLKKKKIA